MHNTGPVYGTLLRKSKQNVICYFMLLALLQAGRTDAKPLSPGKAFNICLSSDTLPPKDTGTLKLQSPLPQDIIFLLDISNSMGQGKKMDLLKRSMQALLEKLRTVDRVSLISFGNDAVTLYRTYSFSKPDSLIRIIERIHSTATATNVNGGIDMAYEQLLYPAAEKMRQEVFLITDGEFKLNKFTIERIKQNPRIRLTAVIVGEGLSAEKAVIYVRETLLLDVVTLVNETRDVNNLLEHIRQLTGAPIK